MAEQTFIKQTFDGISARYDLANTILSGFIDHVWRIKAVRLLYDRSYRRVLDLCAGTLPLSFRLAKADGKNVTALDLSSRMLQVGREKMSAQAREHVTGLICAAGERLPFRSAAFDAAMVAFGVRNLEDLRTGLEEVYRVIRPGGRLVILEFSRPETPLISTAYKAYLFHMLPRMAEVISGDRSAYDYLARSIYQFCDRPQLTAMLKEAGFASVRLQSLTFGVVTIYCADKF